MKTIHLDTSIDYTSWDINEVGSIEMTEWQPIETAPMDGEIILAYGAFYDFPALRDIYLVYWEEDTQSWEIEGEKIIATHWMPLPEPPND